MMPEEAMIEKLEAMLNETEILLKGMEETLKEIEATTTRDLVTIMGMTKPEAMTEAREKVEKPHELLEKAGENLVDCLKIIKLNYNVKH